MHKITADCTGCGICPDACPIQAIQPAGDLYIITDRCNDCGDCVDVCPVEAIVEE